MQEDVIVNLQPPIVEDRGKIQMLVDFTIGSSLVITSKSCST